MWEQWGAPKENLGYKWPGSKNMITCSLMNLWSDFDTISEFYVRWRLPL
jgi:hypothetical protein